MPVLKDFICSCGTMHEAVVDGSDEEARIPCVTCGRSTRQRSICNGGIKGRYRFNDWDGFDPTGYVEHLGIKSGYPRQQDIGTPDESRNATPTKHHRTGEVLHDRARFQKEAIEERRQKRKAAKARKEGRAPITLDLGR